ncbi:MAG: Zn-dependent hydrolase [Acuticoccus sp.]
MNAAAIDSDRLAALLAAINGFGRNADGGFDRPAFSPADQAVRAFFRETMAADGLDTTVDAAGNLFGRFGPAGAAPVMVGSHLDTVPSGGAFDGALGCAAALECVRAIRDAGLPLARPIEVVATADEEGRFGGMLGSQAIAGALPPGFAESAADAEGLRLADAMAAAGLDVAALPRAARPPGSVRAFLELHIEQGPVLEAAGRAVGIATVVSGCTVLALDFRGRANHSGTTPMDMRHDAFVGLARLGAVLPDIAREVGTAESRLTIGWTALAPNAPHTIAGIASCTIIVRDTDAAVIGALCDAIRARAAGICAETGLTLALAERSALPPVALDAGLVRLMEDQAARLGLDAMTMPSGAGHDAQTMAALCPSALIFVPSEGGISHAPQEFTPWPAIEKGAALLLSSVTALAQN